MVEAWLLLAAVDMMAWGVGQVVVKRATDRLGAVTMVLFVTLVDGTLYLAIFLAVAPPLAASPTTYATAALASAVVDNIPFTIAMIPVIQELGGLGVAILPFWWALRS